MSAETVALISPGDWEQASFTSFSVNLAGKYQTRRQQETASSLLCLLYHFLYTATILKRHMGFLLKRITSILTGLIFRRKKNQVSGLKSLLDNLVMKTRIFFVIHSLAWMKGHAFLTISEWALRFCAIFLKVTNSSDQEIFQHTYDMWVLYYNPLSKHHILPRHGIVVINVLA